MPDVIICANFGSKKLSGFGYTGDQIFDSPIKMVGHSYNSAALPRNLNVELPVFTGLPRAKSKISGLNVYKISVQFQDIFVSFTRLKTQKMHVLLSSKMLFIEADQFYSPKNVTKALL